ncbi:MAG: hypothetical protein EBW52_03285, partial [Betaproteobacteria bacterium]|nr:hypothetical protein [Betaproteobacteria bacterium]
MFATIAGDASLGGANIMRNETEQEQVFEVGNRLRVQINAGVADVLMVRGEKMNALDQAMFDALIETGARIIVHP